MRSDLGLSVSPKQALRELYERMRAGIWMCPDCHYMIDTPMHELGCARGRAEREAEAADAR
jgi:ribosomal protein L37AE/L43A